MVFQDSQAPTGKRETLAPQVWTVPVCRETEEPLGSLVLQELWGLQDRLEGPAVTDCLDFKVKIARCLFELKCNC